VQREVSHRLKRDGNPLLDVVRAVNAAVDEQQFNDALTANLRMTAAEVDAERGTAGAAS
jgi:hypothetical protein